jgi:dihydrofolate reductase
MIVSAIAAMAKNRVIGVDNKLPWHLPEDLKYFKEKTKGKILVMGRKTFESFPGALPNRFHIIITRNSDYYPPLTEKFTEQDFAICFSLEEALKLAAQLLEKSHPLHRESFGDEIMISGGGEIYKQSLPYLHRLYLTVIEQDYPGDAKFPEFSSDFKLTEKIDRDQPVPFSFQTFEQTPAKKVSL